MTIKPPIASRPMPCVCHSVSGCAAPSQSTRVPRKLMKATSITDTVAVIAAINASHGSSGREK